MTRILRSLIVVVLTLLLACALARVQDLAQAQVLAQGQRLPEAAPEATEDPPADEEEVQPVDEQDESADAAEEEPPAEPPPEVPQRRLVPQRAQPIAPQRVQPASKPPSQGQPQMPARARLQPPSPTQKQNADGLPSLDDLTATRERPLFSSTRRPPEVEAEEEPSGPITEGASMPFELVGIVLGSDVSAAIFRNTESKEETRVTKGEKIGIWNVEEIVERAVVLRGNDKRVRMRMFDESKSPGIQVGRVSSEDDPAPEEPAAAEEDNSVDEDIAPSTSPQVRPATAQPKPPPSLQNKERPPRRAGRPGRGNQGARRQPRQQP